MKTGVLIPLLTVILTSGSVAVQASNPAPAPEPCPGDYPRLRRFVERILESEDEAWVRAELGLTHVADQPLRVLGTKRDDFPVCAQLYQEVPKGYQVRGENPTDTVVFYQIGDRYILALTSAPIHESEPPLPGGPDQFVGFDLELNKIGGVVYP